MKHFYLVLFILFGISTIEAQKRETKIQASQNGFLANPTEVPSLAEQIRNNTIILADNMPKQGQPKRRRGNNIVPGKGSRDVDPVLQTAPPFRDSRTPLLTFEANISQGTPSDPTGAVGPNHYIGAWNFGFQIFDKAGNPLTAEMSLGSLFPGNNIGDPIVLFDPFIENEPGEPMGRFIITEFELEPNGLNIAVCKGPDPVNDGWWVYTSGFETGGFPDYPKYSIWSDAYYVTANMGQSDKVFALERLKMANGEPAQFIAFPLPGIENNGFFSPHGFNATGGSFPEYGNFPLVYYQDDAWAGVSEDHLKIWTINVDWQTPSNSTISNPAQVIPTSPFISVFDAGGFANLEQPMGPDIDALHGSVMNQAQFRMFENYNAAILNFVVDTDPTAGELAGIRWYELRQNAQGEPWSIHQEGTYIAPDGRHAFAGSMVMDIYGNIGLGYSSLSNTENISIRYTGRLADDPLGQMTMIEELIGQGSSHNPNNRYGDYAHLNIDPVNDKTFWFISEYFNPNRRDIVGVFEHAVPEPNDVAVIDITAAPNDFFPSSNSNLEQIVTVQIQNYGTNPQSNIPVSYFVNGSDPVEEVFTGTVAPGEVATYEFAEIASFSEPGVYRIETRTSLTTDTVSFNDIYGEYIATEGEFSTSDLQIENAELIVSSKNNKHFELSLHTYYNEVLPLQVYDVNGKLLLSNYLENDNGFYTYQLDMSYVSGGAYLVSIGEGKIKKTAKILVR